METSNIGWTTTINTKMDYRKIAYIIANPNTKLHNDENKNSELREQLSSLAKLFKKKGKFEITYKQSSKIKSKFGRMYPYHSPTTKERFGGLDSMKRAVRGYLACDNYIDCDIEKCHWYIIRWKFSENEMNLEYIDTFIENYEKIRDRIMDMKNV
jgi:hypothetical protein